MFGKKRSEKSPDTEKKLSLKRADFLITGVLLGGVLASIYGINRARHKKDEKGTLATENPHAEKPESDSPENSRPSKKPGFFPRLYHAIRYGHDPAKR